jgi:hypothetical protein
VPAPQRAMGVAYVRPVYAPALVAWVGGGATVAWFALGPREVYVPSYAVSRNYVNNVNVSNTTVNRTVVNNYYNDREQERNRDKRKVCESERAGSGGGNDSPSVHGSATCSKKSGKSRPARSG